MEKNNSHLGIILLLIGALMLFSHFDFIQFAVWDLWPLILIYLGIKSERDYFSGYKGSRSLLTGAVLTTYGVYFMISNFSHYTVSNLFWPLFILGPALGFLQMAYYGHKPSKNYKRGIILSIIAGAFFFDELLNFKFNIIIAIALIVFGVYLIFRNRLEDASEDGASENSRFEDDLFGDDEERYTKK